MPQDADSHWATRGVIAWLRVPLWVKGFAVFGAVSLVLNVALMSMLLGGRFIRPRVLQAPTSSCPVAGTNAPGAADAWGGCYPGPGNTGYLAAPGYNPGVGLSTDPEDCPTGGDVQPNTTYSFCYYPDGVRIGNSSYHPANVTFYGSLFESNAVQDANTRTYGDNTTFSYSTFKPSTASVPPVDFGDGYQYAINPFPDGVKMTIDHNDIWGFGNAIAFDNSSASQPVVISDNWIHDASGNTEDPEDQYHTDGILVNDGGTTDHVTIHHNSIVSVGITNGVALQYESNPYEDITLTKNYFSGFGITVNIGGAGAAGNTNIEFTDNMWGSDIQPDYYPIYNEATWVPNGHNGSLWKRNKIAAHAGDSWMSTGNNGLYWWPSDINPVNGSEIVGHATDYPGP